MDFLTILSHLPCSILIKNKELQFVAANQKAADFTGFKKAKDMIGLTDFELKCPAAEFAKAIQKQDLLVLDEGQQHYLDIGYYPSKENISILLTTKTQILDQHSQLLVLSSTIELPVKAVNRALFGLLDEFSANPMGNFSYLVKSSIHEIELSNKQSECLYYLLRGKSVKDIASIQQRSPRTIEDHIYLLKCKFDCQSKSELIEKAFQLGFGQTIPPSLFKRVMGCKVD
jgi:DNA-binding CsgD family transcriptional regulator